METKETKKIKKKGPIRFEAIIPFTVLIVLVGLYTKFFLDSHLRFGMEKVGGMIHGAEVNVTDVKTSFLGGTFDILGIQVTNKESPSLNLIKLDRIGMTVSWDALLRGKFVVPEAGIEGISLNSKRDRPGEVYPIAPKKASQAGKIAAEAKDKVLKQSKQEFEGNILGDVATVLDGTNAKDQLRDIRGELASEKRVDELEALLKIKEEEWKQKAEKFKDKEELKALQAKLKAIKIDKKKPWESLKEVKKVTGEIKAKVNEIKNTSKDLKNDINYFKNSIAEIDDLVKKDLKDLESRVKLPVIDAASFAKKLLGNMFIEKMGETMKYVELARQYMPPPKEKEVKVNVAKEISSKGRLVRFPITTSYPLFWLKEAKISMVGEDTFKGALTNVTSNPSHVGKPAVFSASGDLSKQNIFGINLKATIDHVTSVPKESLEIRVNSLPTPAKELSKSESAKLTLKEGTASSNFIASISGENVLVSWENRTRKPAFDVSAKNERLKRILQSVTSSLPELTLNAKAEGHYSALRWTVNSNLGTEFSRAIKSELGNQFELAKAELKQKIDAKIGPKKEKLMGQYNKLKDKFDDLLNKNDKEVDQLANSAEKDAESSSAPTPENIVDEAKDKLLKGLKKKIKF
ncbi:MAG: hypothetical protein OHK0056_20960 [Bacteriovoracaceae bacterium]